MKQRVTFVSRGENQDPSNGGGISENVSAGGILFLTESKIEVGASISLDLHVPTLYAEKIITLHAEGTVLRVEPAGTDHKVAAEIRFDEDPEDGFASTHTIQ